MFETTSTTQSPAAAAADTTVPATTLTSEQFLEQLRSLLAQAPDVPALTPQERRLLQRHRRVSDDEVQAAINVVQASDKVAGAVDASNEILVVMEANNRWKAVESQLKAALQGIADANLVRRQRMALFAIETYGFSKRLASRPENADLVPHVQEFKRVRANRRRKKAEAAPPAPVTATTP